MSRFRASYSGIVASAHEHHFAQPVVVNTAGTSVTTPCVLHRIQTETRDQDGVQMRVSLRKARFTQINSVSHEAIVTAESVDWQIDAIHSSSASGVEVTLIRHQVNEAGRTGYRK